MKEELSKILPTKYPEITTYTQHAHMLSILYAYDFTTDWIISNYILLYCQKDLNFHSWADFYTPLCYVIRSPECCKYLLKQKITAQTIKNMHIDIIDFICNSISCNNYVNITLDNYYLFPSIFFNKQHVCHDMMIYGFDKEKEVFYCSDFTFTVAMNYSSHEISFSDMINAYTHPYKNEYEHYMQGLIYLYQIIEPKDCSYVFDIRNIINQLRAYYNCNVLENWKFYHCDDRNNIVFGLDVYDSLINYIENTIQQKSTFLDIRLFYLVYNHKRIMITRINYLSEHYPDLKSILMPLLDSYVKIEKLCNLAPLIITKWRIQKKHESLNEIISIYQNAKSLEKSALKEFFQKYDNNAKKEL